MTRAVAKGNYVRGYKSQKKAVAHAKYIAHRPGPEIEHGKDREFYSNNRDDISLSEVIENIKEQDERWVTMHRVILSPGHNDIDLKEYTRETMETLSNRKGQDLNWFSTNHENTDHHHAHVCIMGKPEGGGSVRLDRLDYESIRLTGDKILERELGIDRFVPSEGRESTEKEFEKELDDKWLADEISRYEYGDEKERSESERALQERMAWDFLEKLYKTKQESELFRMTGKQFQTEMAGRHSSHHETAQRNIAREYWTGVGLNDSSQADFVASELQNLDQLEQENLRESEAKTSFDDLLKDIDYQQGMEKLHYDYLFSELPIYDQIENESSEKHLQENDSIMGWLDVKEIIRQDSYDSSSQSENVEVSNKEELDLASEGPQSTTETDWHSGSDNEFDKGSDKDIDTSFDATQSLEGSADISSDKGTELGFDTSGTMDSTGSGGRSRNDDTE